jgi:LCP family protein required for cell wall assembly
LSDPARRLHRTWPQRLLISCNCLLVLACFVISGVLAYGYSKVRDIGRVQLGAVLTPEPAGGSDKPQNFLIVGTDSAEGLDPGDDLRKGRPGGIRSDTIMVLRIDPKSDKAALLSLPRDLYVPIAGTRGSDRINSAIQAGPQRLVETIKQDFGIPINHYVEINFLAFLTIVKAIDGVPIYFPNPARDEKSGLVVPEAGCVNLDPQQALGFARSRAYEEQVNGRWRTDGTGDLGRISRQQLFIRRVLQRAISKGARNPAVLNDLISAGVVNVHLDPTLTAADLLSLGQQFKDFNPDTLDTYSVPASSANVHGGSVLKIDPIRAEPVFRLFRDVEGELSPNASVVVQVNNGTGTADQAEQVAADLRRIGFTVPKENTGEADRFDYEQTTVWYLPGREAEGKRVASYLIAGAKVEQTKLPLSTADVLVITGNDYNGVLDQPMTSGPSSTTTTVTIKPDAGSTTSTTLAGSVPQTPEDVSC